MHKIISNGFTLFAITNQDKLKDAYSTLWSDQYASSTYDANGIIGLAAINTNSKEKLYTRKSP